MSEGKTIKTLKRMNRIILNGHTGTPDEFAQKLGMQRSSFFLYKRMMSANGVPIKYSRTLRSYYYDYDGDFFVGFLPLHIKNML